MRQTENFKLNLFDGSDLVSMAAINANTEVVDAAMHAQAERLKNNEKNNAEQFDIRAKIATGSYAGATATKSPEKFSILSGKSFAPNFGAAVSSGKDLIFTLNFVPKEFRVAASRSAYISWAGSLHRHGSQYDDALAGFEIQAAEMTACYGSEFAETRYVRRFPAVYTSGTGDSYAERFVFHSTAPMSEGGAYSAPFGAFPRMTRVTFAENDDGTCTVTIHGTDATRATVNYLDIEGMTYHWVAIG